MKQLLSIMSLLMSFSSFAIAQVYCTNQTDKGAWIAVAYHHIMDLTKSAAESPYVTEGWLYVVPYDTIQVGTHLGWNKQYGCKSNYYFYAYQPGGRNWSGTRYFLVNTNPDNVRPDQLSFRVEFANKTGAAYKGGSIQPLGFKKGTNQNEGKFLIILREDDENDPPVTPEEKNFFEPSNKKYGQTQNLKYDD
ncbi:MAG: hypothetical protein JNM36_00240 [Chitinophagales bacterium]|jgi:hypothetical protein|nr:hypothetical protein [Chitinophagales bacterium]